MWATILTSNLLWLPHVLLFLGQQEGLGESHLQIQLLYLQTVAMNLWYLVTFEWMFQLFLSFSINASYHIMSFSIWINWAAHPCLLTWQLLISPMLGGILKRECVVLPVDNIDAATPEVAVSRAIKPFDLNVLQRMRYKYVFLVPPRTLMKKL